MAACLYFWAKSETNWLTVDFNKYFFYYFCLPPKRKSFVLHEFFKKGIFWQTFLCLTPRADHSFIFAENRLSPKRSKNCQRRRFLRRINDKSGNIDVDKCLGTLTQKRSYLHEPFLGLGNALLCKRLLTSLAGKWGKIHEPFLRIGADNSRFFVKLILFFV